MENKKIFSSASRMTEEDQFVRALYRLDVEGIKKGIETFGINAKLSDESTISVDNGMDYVHYRETVRPLDLVKGRSEVMENWLRSLGAKTQAEFEAEERKAERAAQEAEMAAREAKLQAEIDAVMASK